MDNITECPICKENALNFYADVNVNANILTISASCTNCGAESADYSNPGNTYQQILDDIVKHHTPPAP